MAHPKVTKHKSPEKNIMDHYSPIKLGTFPVTSPKKKPDVFRTFRPRQGEALDYNISETFLTMEHHDTQINYRETKAEYVPAPEDYVKKLQKRRRIVYSHGAPPQWEFINELWLKKQDEMQKVYKNEFENYKVNVKRRNIEEFNSNHCVLMELAGPDWYQELSPRQIKTIDELGDCIKRDRLRNEMCCTQESLARLGLVYRPHHGKIEVALKYCCGCPVEFLLILYQLLNPRRKRYSVNDRLLLSAVVHLTITQTLRELHVRIPSPIRVKEKRVSNKSKLKQKKYSSPYLVPYTFKPEPQKYTGVYYKKHVFYPDSPYFSYIENMLFDLTLAQNYSTEDLKDLTEDERELLEETLCAEKIFNEIHNTSNMKLLRPTIVNSCTNYEEYKQSVEKKNITRKLSKIKLPSCSFTKNVECQCALETENNSINDPQNVQQTVSSLCSLCSWTKHSKNINSVITGVTVVSCNETVPILGGIYFAAKCNCAEKLKNLLELSKVKKKFEHEVPKFVINGIVQTKIGLVYCLSTAIWNNRLKILLRSVNDKKEDGDVNEIQDSNNVNCETNAVTTPEEPSLFCSNKEFSEKKVFVKEEMEEEESCKCKKELNAFLKSACVCEKCNIKKRQVEATYILSGLKDLWNEPPVSVIYGVQNFECSCLCNYLKKIQRLEEYRQRCTAAYQLKKKEIKYALGGVTYTEKGPVYQIFGIRPPVHCICGEEREEEERLKENLKRVPRTPTTGRVKYGIGGVKETSQENIYIISQTLDSTECNCEELYTKFLTRHQNCWEEYEHFLEELKNKKQEYTEEYSYEEFINYVPMDNKIVDEGCRNTNTTDCNNYSHPCNHKFESNFNDRRLDSHEVDKSGQNCTKLRMRDAKTNGNQHKHCNCDKSKANQVNDGSSTHTSNNSIDNPDGCTCECVKSDSLKMNSNYAIKQKFGDDGSNVQKPNTLETKRSEVKRFVLLKAFPHNKNKQRSIIKEVLEGMAKDGFPLAKLPYCYKLPHIRLWLEIRSGRKWTQADKRRYDFLSLYAWAHMIICYNHYTAPKLDLTHEDKMKITWQNAEKWRSITDEVKYQHRRKIKKHLINKTKEFIPSTFDYEFPSPHFRKCLFAYLPNKEEDVIIR